MSDSGPIVRENGVNPEMKIIPRYILRHFFPVFGLALSAIVGLYLIIDFFEKVDNLLEKHVPAGEILSYFLLKIPFILTQGIPMAVLLGSLVALGILKRNRELIALETAGIKATTYCQTRSVCRPGAFLGSLYCG